MSHVEFKKLKLLHVSDAYFCPCHISNLRKGHVTCQISFFLLFFKLYVLPVTSCSA